MDDRSFDQLARTAGQAGGSRRGVLRLLAGAFLAGPLALVGAEDAAAACARAGKKCGKDKACCRGTTCKGGRCRCKRGTECGGRCCPPGQRCAGGRCLAGGTCDASDQVTACHCVRWEGATTPRPDVYDWCRTDLPTAEECFAACTPGPSETAAGFGQTGLLPGHKPVCGANKRWQYVPC